jgi:hypothetical protein
MIIPNQRENILTEYAFFYKTFRILTNFHTQKGDAGGPSNTPRKFLQVLYCII